MIATTKTGIGVQTGAKLLVKSLETQGVKHVFGVPGAKSIGSSTR
jgi:thiamine pyrophosphate-dependent acetolactate synthase large subunit-like protein